MNNQANNPTSPDPIGPGDKIDKYEIVEQIGAGGMSIVWKGHDALLNQAVAIKQALPESIDVDDQTLRERVRIEAELQKRVTHGQKHVVALKDLIEDDRGLFIVMEYVDGVTLEQRMAATTGPVGIVDALGVVGAVALALDACHKNSVFHRDLKPSNILLPKSGGLKVCDFGLAALLGEQGALSAGTVRYMAPELFRGDTVDGRADIYSLGVIAYELLAGREKFNEAFKIVLRDQRNQALRWMKWHTNPRATAPVLSQLNPKVPDTLCDLVARMMAKDPANRVESASQLISAIRRHFADGQGGKPEVTPPTEGEQAAAAPTTAVSEPTTTLPRKSRWPIALAAVLIIQVLIGAGYGVWSHQQKKAQMAKRVSDSQATYDLAKQNYDQRDWDGALTNFNALIADWSPTSILGRKSDAYAKLVRGRKLFDQGQYAQAREQFYAVLDADLLSRRRSHIQTLIDEASKRLSFDKVVKRAELAISEGRYGEARSIVSEQSALSHTDAEDELLIELNKRINNALNRKHVELAISRAKSAADAGNREQALFELEQAQLKYQHADIAAAMDAIRRDGLYNDAMQAAMRSQNDGKLAAAITSYEKAQKIRANDEVSKRIRALKGQLAYNDGRDKERAGDGEAAMAAYTQAAGFGHSQARLAMNRIESSNQVARFVRAGDTAMANGDFEAAIEHYESALSMESAGDVRTQLTNAKVRYEVSMGEQMMRQGDITKARQAFARARQLAPGNEAAMKGLARIDLRANYMQLLAAGDELRSQGKLGDAKDRYRQARALIKTEEVQQRLSDTEYEHLIEKAKFYMRKREWKVAHAWLLSARKIRNTEQVQKLLIEVELHTSK